MGHEHPLDSELWQRAAAHDSRAFGQLFDRHAKKVYNHCFRRTADWSLAEDLTSVVFLEAWRRRKDVVLHEDSILPWLLAVANNCLRNADRSRRRYHRLLVKLPRSDTSAASDADVAERLDDVAAVRRVLALMETLRAEDQEVISLCDWSELTYEQAATALGIPVGTVRSRLSRARAHLREVLEIATQSSNEQGDVRS